MDEVHYLSDRFRGAVWEEVIIHLPESVRLVSLSATVCNAEEFGDWLVTVRGETDGRRRGAPAGAAVAARDGRPAPARPVVDDDRRGRDAGGQPRAAPARPRRGAATDGSATAARRRGRRRPQRSSSTPDRADVVERLDRDGLLPAIVFIFSRAGCDAAVEQCLRVRPAADHAGRAARRSGRSSRSAAPTSPDEDLDVLGYYEWLDGLSAGSPPTTPGMLPTFKEVVEELFQRGLVKVVFATETLALGINMPARTVVLEKLVKWNGETHADITPGEYTQLTGRAGPARHRRRGARRRAVAARASTRARSPGSPRPAPTRCGRRSGRRTTWRSTWSARSGGTRAREMLESSFAQFQADRAVVGLARQVRRNEEALAGYREAMTCHLGDFEEYAALRRAALRPRGRAVPSAARRCARRRPPRRWRR